MSLVCGETSQHALLSSELWVHYFNGLYIDFIKILINKPNNDFARWKTKLIATKPSMPGKNNPIGKIKRLQN